MLSAIRDLPVPTNITDAGSWFGLINQVAYTFAASKEMQSFHELLKPGKWYWDSNMDTLFQKYKDVILKLIHQGVKYFEPNRTTCLATDWSKDGVGFVLLQKRCQCSMDAAPHCCPEGCVWYSQGHVSQLLQNRDTPRLKEKRSRWSMD